MSFRCPYVTDFIYQASEETKGANEEIKKVLEKYGRVTETVDERGYGYFSGILRNLDSSIQDTGIEKMVFELEKVTKVPFRLTILLEAGPSVTFMVSSRV